MAHHDTFNTSGLRQSPALPANVMPSAAAFLDAAITFPPESPFLPLVTILKEYSSRGENRVLRSLLGERLRREYPGLYAKAGAFSFSQYLSMAEGRGYVIVGGTETPGKEYASLPGR
ncbi:hypothetical protein BD410DRAFT_846753 [Rickenella mellea]|uniref:Uncharacterized protein n=1 Tax=Rickenella mellea TaxID=50990 RepID=A0A4Y7PF28_9AGAM|nr:hypothetical protein BD410DRAFT_846753 [Rickenella mellea]